MYNRESINTLSDFISFLKSFDYHICNDLGEKIILNITLNKCIKIATAQIEINTVDKSVVINYRSMSDESKIELISNFTWNNDVITEEIKHILNIVFR